MANPLSSAASPVLTRPVDRCRITALWFLYAELCRGGGPRSRGVVKEIFHRALSSPSPTANPVGANESVCSKRTRRRHSIVQARPVVGDEDRHRQHRHAVVHFLLERSGNC